MKSYVLDACALIAFFNDENGAEHVEEVLLGDDVCLMSIVNVYEVCYNAAKISGTGQGLKMYEEIQQLPLKIIKVIGKDLLKVAIYFKVNYKVSVADFFALGLAKENGAIMVSSDHHEFDIIENSKELEFSWIR